MTLLLTPTNDLTATLRLAMPLTRPPQSLSTTKPVTRVPDLATTVSPDSRSCSRIASNVEPLLSLAVESSPVVRTGMTVPTGSVDSLGLSCWTCCRSSVIVSACLALSACCCSMSFLVSALSLAT